MSPIGDLVSQLKPANGRADRDRWSDADRLPLEARVERAGSGWRVRLPVRAEEVQVEKQSVVAEHVVVRRRTAEERARVDAALRREELDIDVDSASPDDATEPIYRTRRVRRPPYKV